MGYLLIFCEYQEKARKMSKVRFLLTYTFYYVKILMKLIRERLIK